MLYLVCFIQTRHVVGLTHISHSELFFELLGIYFFYLFWQSQAGCFPPCFQSLCWARLTACCADAWHWTDRYELYRSSVSRRITFPKMSNYFFNLLPLTHCIMIFFFFFFFFGYIFKYQYLDLKVENISISKQHLLICCQLLCVHIITTYLIKCILSLH